MTHNGNFFDWHIDTTLAYAESFDPVLVVTSYLIATLAGFCALHFNAVIHQERSSQPTVIQLAGGVALGLGIWAMHFTGMLAFALPVPIKYQLTPTVISILPAIIMSIAALRINGSKLSVKYKLTVSSLLLTIGIAAMHFKGMTGMSVNATMVHDPVGFAIAVSTSWILAYVTVFIQFGDHAFFTPLTPRQRSALSAATYGFSVASMHYLAMQATYFLPQEASVEVSGLPANALAFSIVLAVMLLISLLAVVVFYRSKVKLLAEIASTNQSHMVETIDNLADPFLLSNPQGKVLSVNQRFSEYFPSASALIENGATLAQLNAHFMGQLFKFASENEREQANQKIAKNDKLTLRQTNGTWWLFRQTTAPSGNIMLSWTNISEQKQTELKVLAARNESQQALIKLQETQEALVESRRLASIGKLVGHVAHELNTPLGIAITSLSSIKIENTQLISNIKAGKLTKTSLDKGLGLISEFEELASKNIARAESIVRQFRFLSLEEQTEQTSTVNVYNTLKHVLTDLESAIDKIKPLITINAAPDLEFISYQDGLFQVLKAIVGNAIFHAFENIQKPKLLINAELIDNQIEIEIFDNGQGIPGLISDVVFDPFVTSKRSQGHIGLGLHIAHNLTVEHLKGSITIVKSDNTGTHIKLSLPVNLAQSVADFI